MFVASVICPFSPACEIISASRAWFFAFKTSCLNPASSNNLETSSEDSTDVVPIRIGWPFSCLSLTSFTNAFNFESFVA